MSRVVRYIVNSTNIAACIYTKFNIYYFYDMWKIYESSSTRKAIKKLPIQLIKVYEIWQQIVSLDGKDGLKRISGFKDEPLKGEWFGYRSSRLNIKYRVIYKAHMEQMSIYVHDITAHDYRRG